MKKFIIPAIVLIAATICCSSLKTAVNEGNVADVKKFIAEGQNVNEKDDQGNTLLMIASDKGYTDIARLLVAAKADKNIKNKNQLTALMIASNKGNTSIADLLKEKYLYNSEDTKQTASKIENLIHKKLSSIKEIKKMKVSVEFPVYIPDAVTVDITFTSKNAVKSVIGMVVPQKTIYKIYDIAEKEINQFLSNNKVFIDKQPEYSINASCVEQI